MEKITEYNKLIGKEISKIEEDGFHVRFYFTDNTYSDVIGSSHGGFVGICEYKGVEQDPIVSKCCVYGCQENVHTQGSVYCEFHASM